MSRKLMFGVCLLPSVVVLNLVSATTAFEETPNSSASLYVAESSEGQTYFALTLKADRLDARQKTIRNHVVLVVEGLKAWVFEVGGCIP